jgi:hypothetical protein
MTILGIYDTLRSRGALQDVESAQPTSGQVSNDPSAFGPGLDGVAPPDPGSRQTTQFLGKNYDSGLSDTQVDQARSKARVSTMRQYSLNDEANAQEKADADVGLQQAHSKYFNAEGAAKELATKTAAADRARIETARRINEAAGARIADLKDEAGNSRPATHDELIGVAKDRLTHLTSMGLTEDADKAQTEFASLVGQKVTMETAERNRAAAPALAALQLGEFQPALDWAKKFVPGGAPITNIQAGSKPGTVKVTVGAGGKTHTQEMTTANVAAEIQKFVTMAASSDPKAATEFLTGEALKHAQTEAQLASAAHSRAGAAKEGAQTADIKESTSKKKQIDDALTAASPAYDKPEAERTAADKLAITKYERLQSLEKLRGGGGGAAKSPARAPFNAKIRGRDVTVRTDESGNMFYLDTATDAKGNPIPGGAPVERPISKADLAAGNPAPVARPQNKGDYDKLPSGTQYIAPNGQTLVKK